MNYYSNTQYLHGTNVRCEWINGMFYTWYLYIHEIFLPYVYYKENLNNILIQIELRKVKGWKYNPSELLTRDF